MVSRHHSQDNLSEATSTLVPESEAGICKTLQKLRGDLRILANTHHATFVNATDRVYKVQNGSINLIVD